MDLTTNIAGEFPIATFNFSTGYFKIPSDASISIAFPSTPNFMDFSSCTNAQIFFYGDSGEYGTQNSFTGGISTTATANSISLVRDGSGEDILRDAPERSTLTIKCQIRNALYEGATGDFTVTTTSSGGVDLNVVTGE